MKNKFRKYLIYLIIMVVVGTIIGIYLAFGPPQLLAKSESVEFCASCHVMLPQYEAWFYSGPHKRIKCIDCHLPNNNVAEHFFWKGFDGTKDVVIYFTNSVPEPIKISNHGKKVIQSNCIRCHNQMVSLINMDYKNCWDCHKRTTHLLTGDF